MILSSTTDRVEMVLGAAVDVDYTVSYTKLDTSTTPPSVTDAQQVAGTYNTITTPLSITGSPGAVGDRWSITEIEIRNRHATLPVAVSLNFVKTGGTPRQLISVPLAVGEKLLRDKNGVYWHYDASLGVYNTVATAMRRVLLTSGTAATYTPPLGCRAIDVRAKGAGGQGGGSNIGSASIAGAGGGGGEGGETRKLISPPAASYLYTIGAGGSAGGAGAVGQAGADTTFGTLTAKGGSGGAVAVAAAITRALGGAGGVAGSGGDTNDPGAPGEPGIVVSASLAVSGAGAGHGANGIIAQGTGAAAVANTGGGGSGGVAIGAVAAVAGGAGGSGYVEVTEYY